jgi:NhaA family Na+:H+ antiporter
MRDEHGHHHAAMTPVRSLFGLSPDVAGGLALLLAAVAALLTVNLGGHGWYEHLLGMPMDLRIGALELEKTLHDWIGDGLMALFFVLIGIEVHREFRYGEMRDPKRAVMPVAAALGGVAAPVLVYLLATGFDPALHAGMTIPMATDTAFALALLAGLSRRLPTSLRAFVLALAVVDDLMAVAVIALFYTASLEMLNLFLAVVQAFMLWLKNIFKVRALWVYLVAGFVMWLCVLQSGVHATVAGVLLGVLLPLKGHDGKAAPAERVEHALGPFVRWVVLPLFAFANAGVDLTGISDVGHFLTPLVMALAGSLTLGKILGIFGTVWGMERMGFGQRPNGAGWRHVYGLAALCGIGFTMSLFIGQLAFADSVQPQVRLGVMLGSLLSVVVAFAVLRKDRRHEARDEPGYHAPRNAARLRHHDI